MGCVGGSGSITLVFSYMFFFGSLAIGKNKKNRKKDVGWLVNVAAVTEDNKGQARPPVGRCSWGGTIPVPNEGRGCLPGK